MDFREYVKKRRSGEITGQEEEQQVKTEQNNSGFRDYVKQRRTAEAVQGISDRVSSWFEQARQFGSDYNSRYASRKEGQYVGDSADWLLKTTRKSAELDAEADAIRELMREYADYLDSDWSNSVYEAMHSNSMNFKELTDYAQADADYWGQFSPSEEQAAQGLTAQSIYDFWKDHSTVEKRQDWYSRQKSRLEELKAEKIAASSAWDHIGPNDYAGRQACLDKMHSIDDEIAAIETEMRNYERGNYNAYGQYYGSKVVDDYSEYSNRSDFKTVSANRDFYIATRDELTKQDVLNDSSTWHHDTNGVYRDAFGNELAVDKSGNWFNPQAQENLVEDRLGLFLNATESERQEAIGTPVGKEGAWASIIKDGVDGSWSKLTENEIAIYYYLLNSSGQKTADKYLSDMKTELNRRDTMEANQNYVRGYNEANLLEKIALNTATVPAQLVGGVAGFVEDTANTIMGKEINPYSAAHSGMHYSQMVRGATAEDLDATGFKVPVIDFTLGDIYQTGMSILDSYAAIGIGGGLGGALLATNAASSEAARLYQQGASMEQIGLGSAAAGAAEMVFESIGIDKLLKIKDVDTLGGMIKNILKQGGTEALEEAGTEITNIITNAVIMGQQSDWAKLVEENGGDEWKAFLSEVQAVAQAGFGGFLSGVGSASIPSAVSYGRTQAQYANAGKAINYADGGVDALLGLANEVSGATNGRVQKNLNRNIAAVEKNASNRRVGRLYDSVNTANNHANVSANQADIAKSLTRKGFNAETANNIAEALIAKYNGKTLSKAQSRLLESAENNTHVKTAISNIITNDQSTMGQRSKNIRDFIQGISKGIVIKEQQNASQQAEPVTANDRQITGKLTGEESLQISEEASTAEEMTSKNITLEDASKKYGAQAQAMVHTYQQGQDVSMYDAAYQVAYDMGKSGVSFSYVSESRSISYLTDSQKQLAYEAGQAASDTAAKELDVKHKAAANGKTGRKKGVVRGEGVTIADLKRSLNDTQGKAYKYLSTVSEVTGIDIVLYRSEAGPDGKFQGAQGRYRRSEPGTIYIDLNAGLSSIKSADDLAKYAMLRTFSHEFTHFLENWNPIQYNEFRKVVFDTLTQRGENVHDLIEEKQAQKPGMSYDKASREVVAEAMTDILPDANFVQELAKNHKTIFQKLLAQLKAFVENLRDYFNSIGHNPSREANALKEQVGETVKYLDSIVELFDKVAVQAVENYQQTAANEDAVVGSLVEDDAQDQQRNYLDDRDIQDDIYYPQNTRDAQVFIRSYANKTNNIKNGETRNVLVFTKDHAYFVVATGYLKGKIAAVYTILGNEQLIDEIRREFDNGSDRNGEAYSSWRKDNWSRPERRNRDTVGTERSSAARETAGLDGQESGDGNTFGPYWENYGYSSWEELREAVENGAMVMDENGDIITFEQNQQRTDTLTDREVRTNAQEQQVLSIDEDTIQEQSRDYLEDSYNYIGLDLGDISDVIKRGTGIKWDNGNALKLPDNEYAAVKSRISTQYHRRENHGGVQFIDRSTDGREAKQYLYLYVDHGFTNYEIIGRLDYSKQQDLILFLREAIQDGRKAERIPAGTDRLRNFYEHPDSGRNAYQNRGFYEFDGKNDSGGRGPRRGDNGWPGGTDSGGYYKDGNGEQFQQRTDTLTDREVRTNAQEQQVSSIDEDTIQEQSRAYLSEDIYDTNGVHWGIEAGVMTKAEARKLWEAIANIGKRGYSYPRTTSGEHIVSADNALFFVNADYRCPSVNKIIRFNEEYKVNCGYAKELIIDARGNPPRHREAMRDVADLYGEGFAVEYDRAVYAADARKNGPGEGKNRGTSDSGIGEQNQQRTDTLTDREVLAMAANQVKADEILTAAEKDALDIFLKRLNKLEALQTERAEQGRLYKEQQFGVKADRAAAAETLNRMRTLDERIQRASEDVLTVEEKTVLKRVLQKARGVVERQEREHRQQILKRWRDRRDDADAIKKHRAVVEKHAKALMNMLAHPTKDLHVPIELQQPLQEFLESIDFTSKQQGKGDGATIRDVAYTRALMDVRDAVAGQRKAMESAEDGEFTLDVPDSFLADIDKHIKTINVATKGLDLTTNRVYDMGSAELADLGYILGVINKTIRDIDKLHMAGAKARVSELANGKDGTMAEMSRRKPVKSEDGGKAMWANYTPWHAFRRMGKAAQQIFRGLTQGQATLAKNIHEVITFSKETYTAKEVKAWEHGIKPIKLDSGKTIQMTTAQIMSFYCLSKRQHAKGHLKGGGIRISTIKYDAKGAVENKSKELVQKEDYLLTDDDIERINRILTDRQRAVAEALQQYMQTVGGRLNNEISMARWDYMAAVEEGYFPIKTVDTSRDAKSPDQDRTNLWALLNKSFTKGLTEGANNTLSVESIFDVFADHMSEVAEYNAFALPLVDAMKWFNYREQVNGDGTHVKTIGVRKSIEDTLGKAATKYFIDLMTDINSSQKAGRHENALGRILSRYKISAVGWNLRVAIQQPTAILRASMVLDIPSLIKGSVRIGTKNLVQEMQRYSGIARWKSLGYYDLNVSRSVREQIKGDTSVLDKFNETGMWLPGKMDEWTWARIWAATKAKVAREQKVSGEALLKATAELFEDVVYQTQVADSVLTRNSLMRSKSQRMKELTSFLGEPTASLNILLSAFQDYESGHSSWDKVKRGVMIGFYGYALSAVANALVTSFADAWRDDDEYEEFLEKYCQALLGEKSIWNGNLVSELNPLEKVIFVRDILSAFKGYPTSTSYGDLINDTVDLVDSVKKYIQGKGSLTAYGVLYKVLQAISSAGGFGLSNLSREVVGIWNNTIGRMHPDKLIHRYEEKPSAKIRDAYYAGTLTTEEAMQALIDNGVVGSEAEAMGTVEYWSYKQNHTEDVYAAWFDAYYDKVVDSGISVDSYIAYRESIRGLKKKEEIMDVIDSLSISTAKKDALYYAEGWAESKIHEAPWH